MTVHAVNDRFKIKVDADEFGFNSDEQKGTESGIVVEVPENLIYLSFHSFAFEDSFVAKEKLKELREYYSQFQGKRIYWEKFQDKGRRIKESDGEYIYLQMTDLLAYSDNENDDAHLVDDTRNGSFSI